MPFDRTQTLAAFLDALASKDPAPGGGAAAAFAGAAGVSLLLMVAGLPKTRTGAPEEAAELAAAAAALRPLRDTLADLIDDDRAAYGGVVAAYRLGKGSEQEREARRAAIQAAVRAATETPLGTLQACGQALAGATTVARHALPSARSDVAVAIELLTAAARGAAMNVEANLPGLGDTAAADAFRAAGARLLDEATADAERSQQHLRQD